MLGTTRDQIPKFITKKWVKVYDQSGSADDRYKLKKQIRFKTSMLRSDLGDYSDAYVVMKVTITVTDPDNDAYDKELTLKNNAPFVSCILKINNTLIDNAEDLDVVIKNYRKTTESVWNYYRDKANEESAGGGNGASKYSIRKSKSFDHKINITGILEGENTEKEAEIVVPLKHFSNFWKTLDIQLMTC